MDKQDSFTFKKVNGQKFLRAKGMETSMPTINYEGLTINSLVEKTKAKMGDERFFGYEPLKNNCQDFIIALLDSVNAKFDRDFVKQKVEQLAKTVPTWKQKEGKPTIDKVKSKAKKEGIIGRSVHIM